MRFILYKSNQLTYYTLTIQTPYTYDLSHVFAGIREQQGNAAARVVMFLPVLCITQFWFHLLFPCEEDAVSALLERTSAELEAVEQELAEDDDEEEEEQEQRGSEEDW